MWLNLNFLKGRKDSAFGNKSWRGIHQILMKAGTWCVQGGQAHARVTLQAHSAMDFLPATFAMSTITCQDNCSSWELPSLPIKALLGIWRHRRCSAGFIRDTELPRDTFHWDFRPLINLHDWKILFSGNNWRHDIKIPTSAQLQLFGSKSLTIKNPFQL